MKNAAGRWFPTKEQLKDPDATERAFRQLLTQHYELLDRVNAMTARNSSTVGSTGKPVNGPVNTQICGLYVAPVNVKTLADGTKLTYVKASGNLQFK